MRSPDHRDFEGAQHPIADPVKRHHCVDNGARLNHEPVDDEIHASPDCAGKIITKQADPMRWPSEKINLSAHQHVSDNLGALVLSANSVS